MMVPKKRTGRIILGLFLAVVFTLLPTAGGKWSAAYAEAPSLYSGDNGSFTKNGTKALSFIVKNAPAIATDVSVIPLDGQPGVVLKSTDYSKSTYSGMRNLISLKPEFLQTLNYGRYQIAIVYSSGTVLGTFYIFNYPDIYFVEQPETVICNSGDTITYSLQATGSSTGRYTYEWQRKSRTGWKRIKGATSRTLTLKNVEDSLTGYTFRCLVHSADGDAYSNEVKLYIIGAGDQEEPWLYGLISFLSLGGMVGCVLLNDRRKGVLKRELSRKA